jgi:hypothetical protein
VLHVARGKIVNLDPGLLFHHGPGQLALVEDRFAPATVV